MPRKKIPEEKTYIDIDQTLSDEKVAVISAYLDAMGFKAKLSGYNILISVIAYMMDHSSVSQRELFKKYARCLLETSTESMWRAYYRAARYCFLNSLAPSPSFWDFLYDTAKACKDEMYLASV